MCKDTYFYTFTQIEITLFILLNAFVAKASITIIMLGLNNLTTASTKSALSSPVCPITFGVNTQTLFNSSLLSLNNENK